MTSSEKRAHDLAIASLDFSPEMSTQDIYEMYKKRYYELYDYFKDWDEPDN